MSKQARHTVLMTADTVGGVWVYALELARILGRYGMHVVLAAMGGELSRAQRAAAAQLPALTLESRPYKLEWMQDAWSDVEEAGEWLLALQKRHRPSIIHLNNYVHGALPWSAPVVVVGHSCVCSWFESVRGTPAPDGWGEYRSRVARGLEAADAVVAPTRSMLDGLRRHYGGFTRAVVVHNARRTRGLKPLETCRYVLTAGRLWDEAKNAKVLDRAAADVDFPAFAAGATVNPDDGGVVRFDHLAELGVLSHQELARWMGHAAVYALPARYEPFGLTPLEAARCGCALVLGDIPTLRELWDDAAVFVPSDDVDGLRATMTGLLHDRTARDRLAARARRRARRYSTGRMGAEYMGLYAGLLGIEPSKLRIRATKPSRRRIQTMPT